MFVPPNLGLNDPVDLTCSLRKGNTPVTFTWFKNERAISNSSKPNIKIINGPRKSFFSIENLNSDTIGNFTCRATNSFGMDSESVRVYAEGGIFIQFQF